MERMFNLLKVLNDTGGLIGVKSKVKVRNADHLSYVYSPGVGHCCMAIKDDLSLADTLTNRCNSCLVLSDSTGFDNYTEEGWEQDQIIPHLESKCLYFKVCTGIDTYPLILDHKKTKGPNDLHYTLKNLANAYKGIYLYKICTEKIAQLREQVTAEPIQTFFITTCDRNLIQKYLEENFLIQNISVNHVLSCLMRVGMDNLLEGFVDQDKLITGLEGFRKANDPSNHDLVASLHLIEQFTNVFKTEKGIRESYNFVKTYRLYRGERRPTDEFDFTNATLKDCSIYLHDRFKGMIETYPRLNITNLRDLDQILTYENLLVVQNKIKEDPRLADYLTIKRNYSAIITNGTAILGFGDIGPVAGMPVMEGKCILFKEFGRVNMMPMCIDEKDPEEVIKFVERVAPIFTSINLEDIKAPECFHIEQSLIKTLEPAIFHDDQHGTAIVVVGGLINSLKLVDKTFEDIKVVINGAGAAGYSCCNLLLRQGTKHITMLDSRGAIFEGRTYRMNPQKEAISKLTNEDKIEGDLAKCIAGADIFIGVSVANALSQDMIKSMAEKPIIFALANPTPEIMPEDAYEAGAYIVATGRADYPNQVNNSLAFPGIFRSIQENKITDITMEMKLAAARGIAKMIDDKELNPHKVIPDSLDSDVPRMVAKICKEEALANGLIREKPKTDFCPIENKFQLDQE